MFWVAFYSQTGSELLEICKKIHKYPNIIVMNKESENNKEFKLIKHFILNNKPTNDEWKHLYKYLTNCSKSADDILITLHGFLRILPSYFCDSFNIYNGHPGRIQADESLKGFNPQEKAWKRHDELGGCVIHKVVSKVDDGDILRYNDINIKDLNLNDVYEALHKNSINLWVDFLKEMKL